VLGKWIKISVVAALVVGVSGYAALQLIPPVYANSKFISVDDAKATLMDKPDTLVLDVRTPGEYDGDLGHLKGAKNIDFRAISAALEAKAPILDLPKSTPILLHCHTDVRASIAARTLRDAGFENITVIDDGIVAWHEADLPVVHSKP
jgi:rhodanese-related sulfurtransferase